ncbi:phospholipase-like protein [Artemisia annua]|uniref:Phospholipase-like protein n=1 Tax=Artemisia annua TaxID=35608 RepID=A0A2U1KKY2_ARTAN|nr:phospholipase-like protein [Artemisia annua]
MVGVYRQCVASLGVGGGMVVGLGNGGLVVWVVVMEYLHNSKVHVRSKVRYFPLIKARLDEKRCTLFRSTCFGPWLDITYVDNDETLVHHMLEKQLASDDKHYDLSLVYHVNGHLLHFGRREFQLITGPFNFRDRVFPDKIGEHLRNIDLLSLIEDDEAFSKISDEDAIRACLLLALEVTFMGRELISVVADPLVRMVDSIETWNDFPWGEHIWRMLYDIWILEASMQSGRWWTKAPDVLPRAVAWTKKVPFEANVYFGDLFPKGEKSLYELYPSRAERSVKFFNWYVPRPAPVAEVGLVEEYFRKRSEARKKMVAEDAEEAAENRSNLRTVSIMERVEIMQEMCGSLLKLPAEVESLKGRVHRLESVIHIMTRKRRAGDTVQNGKKVEQKCLPDSKKGRLDCESNVPTDVANEYCTNLNDDFLDLFDAPIQKTQKYVVRHHHEPWQKAFGSGLQDVKVEALSDDDVEQDEWVIFDDCEKVAKHDAEVRRLGDVRDETSRVRQEDEKKFVGGGVIKLPHVKLGFNRYRAKNREYKYVLRPSLKEDVMPKHVIPTLETLKSHKNIRDPFMIEMCRDVKPWTEDLNRSHNSIDTIIIDRDFEEFINSSWSPRCKFPWCSDIVVDCIFRESLAGLDNNRSGWLRDEHIDLWVMYMWHFRPNNADWSMVSCYFLTILLQGSMPLFYATNEVYDYAWADVVRVFIPINEPFTHWSLAVFYIQTGEVLFYDSGETYDMEYRECYFTMRRCLRENLPFIIKETGVFEKKGIDPTTYHISFRHVTHIPKQGGVFGDCGIFLCIFLYRLAYGIPLVMDDSIQTAFAYREALIRFYFKHKICCP